MKSLMKTKAILLGMLVVCLSIFSSCSKDSSDDSKNSGNQVTVYTSGTELGKAVVRKNGGVLYTISNGTAKSGASAVFVSGKDVYASGSEEGASGKRIAKIWKNGSELFTLTDGSGNSEALSLFVSGKDVYAAGWEQTSNRYAAWLWKNTEATKLNHPLVSSVAHGVFVSEGNVYVTGSLSSQAAIFKNGMQLYTLADKDNVSDAEDVFVSGNDVYATGWEEEKGSGKRAIGKVWKNGSVLFILSDGTKPVFPQSIYISGTDIYVAGYEENSDRKPSAKVWKNGVEMNLIDGSNDFYATDVYVLDGDVYVSGGNYSGTGKVWKNGKVLYTLPGIATSIFIVK